METKIILEISRPKIYDLYGILNDMYFSKEPKISGNIKDINTMFQINREITIKYERIRKRIMNDIFKIILNEKTKEVNEILYGLNKLINK